MKTWEKTTDRPKLRERKIKELLEFVDRLEAGETPVPSPSQLVEDFIHRLRLAV